MHPLPEVGDTVRLPGFTNLLTVDRIVGDMAQVSWNWPTGRIGRAEHPLRLLVKVEPKRNNFERG